ncbi:MAG: hypothetical protein CSB34_03700 [Desulfobulbus propionicus]|nr:MAG: hypothetical protein CSB34_03700 [Desulfobulbus propionicus]
MILFAHVFPFYDVNKKCNPYENRLYVVEKDKDSHLFFLLLVSSMDQNIAAIHCNVAPFW